MHILHFTLLWACAFCTTFTEKIGTSFEGVSAGAVAFADVDGDGDGDLLITGERVLGIAKLYLNDGAGNFTEKAGTPFDGVGASSVAFADIDGDGDSDLLITGKNNSNLPIAALYINDGTGNFTEKVGTTLDATRESSVAFADVDGDGDTDLLITGINISFENIAKLYLNDGAGNFTEKVGTPFQGVQFSSVSFADVDGDGDADLLTTGLGAL